MLFGGKEFRPSFSFLRAKIAAKESFSTIPAFKRVLFRKTKTAVFLSLPPFVFLLVIPPGISRQSWEVESRGIKWRGESNQPTVEQRQMGNAGFPPKMVREKILEKERGTVGRFSLAYYVSFWTDISHFSARLKYPF